MNSQTNLFTTTKSSLSKSRRSYSNFSTSIAKIPAATVLSASSSNGNEWRGKYLGKLRINTSQSIGSQPSRERRCHTDPFLNSNTSRTSSCTPNSTSQPIMIPIQTRSNSFRNERQYETQNDSSQQVLMSWEQPDPFLAFMEEKERRRRTRANTVNGMKQDGELFWMDENCEEPEEEMIMHCNEMAHDEPQHEQFPNRDSYSSRFADMPPPSMKCRQADSRHIDQSSVYPSRKSYGKRMSSHKTKFIPPHELIQHDCFSLGVQHEFKRKPVQI